MTTRGQDRNLGDVELFYPFTLLAVITQPLAFIKAYIIVKEDVFKKMHFTIGIGKMGNTVINYLIGDVILFTNLFL